MGKGKEKEGNKKSSATFRIGAVSLAFLIIGYQAALFIGRASELFVESRRENPDTVYVVDPELASELLSQPEAEKREAGKPVVIRKNSIRSMSPPPERRRSVESFRFNPNTASAEDFRRLGFSEKQAASIVNYREKGGRFRRKTDFAGSYVVPDSVFRRLEPYIDIPLTDINRADSASFDDLPGIGPYFASKLVAYRGRLGGFSFPEQMMDIHNFDSLKFAGLRDLICCSRPEPYPLWTLEAGELRLHPYINSFQTARAIVFFRDHNPVSKWTVGELALAGILSPENAEKLGKCVIEEARSTPGVVAED